MPSFRKIILYSPSAAAFALFAFIIGCGNTIMTVAHIQDPTQTGNPPQPTPSPIATPPSVSSTRLVGLHIANPAQIVRSETPYAFKAIADYSDGSSADVSSAVTWSGSSAVTYISSGVVAFWKAPEGFSPSGQSGSLLQSYV